MNKPKMTTHRVTMPDDMALEYLDKLLVVVNKQFLDPGFPIALSMAIDKMRAPLPDNKALTVEELRGMDGQPVYMVDLTGGTLWTQWVIFSSHSDYGFVPRGGGWFCVENYEKTWVCYRRPPEKGE